MASTAVIQLHHRETFERNVTRAVVAGGAAGLAGLIMAKAAFPVGLTTFWPLALMATGLAFVRGTAAERLTLSALAVVLPAVPLLFGLTAQWTVAVAGAALGALVVKARVAEKGQEGAVAAERPGPGHYVGTAVATGALAVAGTGVAEVLGGRMAGLGTPELLTWAASGATLGLFASLGSLASHVALKSDPVEARCEELAATLGGEFGALMSKALMLYRQSGAQLAALPREPAREELARTLTRLTRDATELAAEWSGVEASVQDSAQADLKKEILELRRSATTARDPVARAQLEQAAASLEEELGRLGELKLKRERVLARLKAQVALLERARVALIGMRSSHATVRAAEMSAVARKLNALATGQADEAALAHGVATQAELNALEVAEADRSSRRTLAAAGLEPIAPVDGGPERTADPDDKIRS